MRLTLMKDSKSSMASSVGHSVEQLTNELRNFEEIARGIVPRPGSIPELKGIEVYGKTLPLNGIVGGDHLIYVDFKKRHDLDARIQLAEEAGRPDIVASLDRCRRMSGVAPSTCPAIGRPTPYLLRCFTRHFCLESCRWTSRAMSLRSSRT